MTTAHQVNKRRLRQYLMDHPDTRLADLIYTPTARRIYHVHRDAYVATSASELLRQSEQPTTPLPAAKTSSVVLAFMGQGASHVGMGGTLYRTPPRFRRLLDSYQHLCNAEGLDCQFLDLIRGSQDASSMNATTTTAHDMQVAFVTLEIALARYWQSYGLRPTLLIGHSLGEYAALCVAGVLSVGDALSLACERATLIFTKCPPPEPGMLAVALPASTVKYRFRDSAATVGCNVSPPQ